MHKRIQILGLATTTALLVLSLSLVALPQATASRSISPDTVLPGETFTATVSITADQDIMGLGLDENLPDGWILTPVDNGGAVYSASETAWVWLVVSAADSYTVVYDVTVPVGAAPGAYSINGTVSSASPSFQNPVTGEDIVTVPPPLYTLTMAVVGSGTTSPAVGTYTYDEGTVVPLSATPAAGWEFDHWSGDVTGSTNPTSVTMSGNKLVAAHFVEIPTDLCRAISDGVVWLASEQNPDGSWGTGSDEAMIATTAFVVLKLATHATDPVPPEGCGFGLESPFDSEYPYKQPVIDGLDYLFAHGYTRSLSAQNHGGQADDPDTNGNGIGIYFGPNEDRTTYDTAISLMAISASQGWSRIVNVPGSPLNGMPHRDVAQDAVDFLAFGQVDTGQAHGGWGYLAADNADGWVDNSNSGYAVMGLGYAASPRPHGFELAVPQFVRDEVDN